MATVENEEPITVKSQPSKGEFPFPIMDGERESQVLTWVRNHSSYLTVGGFLGALQAGAAYTRGVIGNLIILMTLLIPIGIVLGLLHHVLIESPLVASQYSMLIGLVLTLLYFGYDIGKNYVAGRTTETENLVGTFQHCWRFFSNNFIAITTLLVGLVLLIDLSPHIIEFVRKNFVLRAFGLKECAAAVLATAGAAGGLIRYFPKKYKFQVQILVVLVGLLSFAIIWGLALRIANYVYYGLPPYDWQFWLPLICLGLLAVTGCVAIWNARGVGWLKQSMLFVLTLLLALLLIVPCLKITIALKHSTDSAGEGIGTLTRPLARVANGLTLADTEGQKDSVEESRTQQLVSELISRKLALDAEAPTEFDSPRLITTSAQKSNWLSKMSDWVVGVWKEAVEPSEFRPRYYARTALFLEQFETISDANPTEHRALLRRLTRSAIETLAENAGLDDVQTSPIEFQRIVLRRVLTTSPDVGFANIVIPDISRKNSDELKDWLNQQHDLIPIREKLATMRVPISMAKDYLQFSKGRTDDITKFDGKSSPDFALNGPALFSNALLQIETLKKEFALAKLRRALLCSETENIRGELAKLDDAWFASHGTSREDFEWCANVGRSSLVELVDTVLLDEADVNANAIKKFVQENYLGNTPGTSTLERSQRKAMRHELIEIALDPREDNYLVATHVLGELYDPTIPFESELGGANSEENAMLAKMIYRRKAGLGFSEAELLEILAAQFVFDDSRKQAAAGELIRRMAHGKYGSLNGIENVGHQLFEYSVSGRLLLLAVVLGSLLLFCLLFIDPNSTSVHGFYRSRLASAFILGFSDGKVEPEHQVLLSQLNNYDSGKSTAPYHLINAAINLQNGDLPDLRDRNADFFIFSKLFVGGKHTGFVRTSVLEAVSPKLDTSSAMAISAGAASPNMGQYTVSLATFLLTVLNVRLGYWIPNPDRLQASSNSIGEGEKNIFTKDTDVVFSHELMEIRQRRFNAGLNERADLIPVDPEGQPSWKAKPSISYDLFGLAFSGGGIRSAAVNMGLLQVLEHNGLFGAVDYLSTVSGGGYLGCSVSTFMRNSADQVQHCEDEENKRLRQPMDVRQRQIWRPRFGLLYKEMFSLIDAKSRHINVSDGGHVENLGAYELLRRRCKIIIVGEGESDPDGKFSGLSTLMRLAEIDMNIKIDFRDGSLRRMFGKPDSAETPNATATGQNSETRAKSHFAVAKIKYPKRTGNKEEFGYLLYLRSSLVGNEDQIIQSYERSNTAFPHESTADQMFGEGQFEAYRRLGMKMMSDAISALMGTVRDKQSSYHDLQSAIEQRWSGNEGTSSVGN